MRFERLKHRIGSLAEVAAWPQMLAVVDRALHEDGRSAWEYPVAACERSGAQRRRPCPGRRVAAAPLERIRIHRSHVVNLGFVHGFERLDGDRVRVRMRNGDTVPASRAGTVALRKAVRRHGGRAVGRNVRPSAFKPVTRLLGVAGIEA